MIEDLDDSGRIRRSDRERYSLTGILDKPLVSSVPSTCINYESETVFITRGTPCRPCAKTI